MNPGMDAPDDAKLFLGRGWAMPVEIDLRTGCTATVAYEQDVREAIFIVLETARGERVMRPDFGCGIHELVFESMDSTMQQRVRSEVESALRRFEPRIEVLGVRTDPVSAATDGRLAIELEYRVRKTNQVGNLVYPFYFREGGRP